MWAVWGVWCVCVCMCVCVYSHTSWNSLYHCTTRMWIARFHLGLGLGLELVWEYTHTILHTHHTTPTHHTTHTHHTPHIGVYNNVMGRESTCWITRLGILFLPFVFLVGQCSVDLNFLFFLFVIIVTVIAGMLIHTNRYRNQMKTNTSGYVVHCLCNNIHWNP